MYIEMENIIKKKEKRYRQGFLNTMPEMHTLYRLIGVKDNVAIYNIVQ